MSLKTFLLKVRNQRGAAALTWTRDGGHGNVANAVSTDWAQEDTEVPGGTTHLWEESWDDDDENEDFSKQLKYVRSRIRVMDPGKQY